MQFRRGLQRYGRMPDPETAFSKAGQLWDDRIGSARSQAYSWRLMAFGCLGLSCAMSGGLVWQSMQSRVTPYIVEVDRLGEARAVSPAEAAYQPTDAQIAWHLAHFVTDIRSVSLDPVLTRRSWLEAYDFVTRRGAQAIGSYARTADPFAGMGDRTVSVEVISVVRASDRSFQVKWTEAAFVRGVANGTTHWTAMLTIVRQAPVNADTLRKNPLGLYVDAIDWSRELEPTPPPQPDAPPATPAMTASPPPKPQLEMMP